MRVLLVTPDHPPDVRTGRSAAFARLAARLADRYEIRLVAGYHRDRGGVPASALGVDLRGAGALGTAFALWRAAREEVARFDPDVVIGSGLSVPLVARPTVAVIRDLVGTGWEAPVRRVSARRLRHLVVPTERVRRELARLGVDPWRVEVIPDGFDVPEVAPGPAPDGPVLALLHPGAVHPAKGQHLSIDAVSRLSAEDRRRVRLVIAGHVRDPRYAAQLRVAAQGQPVEIVVDPPALEPFVDAAHLVLYPTALDEGFPDGAVLALARGRPVAWSDRPALRETLGGAGIPVLPGSVPSLRDVVRGALSGTLDLRDRAVRGHAFARERYAWDHVLPRWRTLIGGTARPTR